MILFKTTLGKIIAGNAGYSATNKNKIVQVSRNESYVQLPTKYPQQIK